MTMPPTRCVSCSHTLVIALVLVLAICLSLGLRDLKPATNVPTSRMNALEHEEGADGVLDWLHEGVPDLHSDFASSSGSDVDSLIPRGDALAKQQINDGKQLLCFLQYDAGLDAEYKYNGELIKVHSPYSTRSELVEDGWTYLDEEKDPEDPDIKRYSNLEGYKSMLEALEVSTNWESPYCVKWIDEGKDRIGTKGFYVNNYNTEAGMIMAMELKAPSAVYASSPLGIMPQIRRWSDVTFIEYNTRCDLSKETTALPSEPKHLKYIVAHVVLNEDTAIAVSEVYGEGIPIPRFSAPDVKDLSTTSPLGLRLLGTPIGKQVAYLLIQHKQEFGVKTISHIKVFRHDEASAQTAFASLLFFVEDVTAPSTERHMCECLVS